MKQIFIAVIAIVSIIAVAMYISGDSEIVTAETSNNFYGQEEGVITLTEYADFQCPACGGFFPIISQVKEQFKDQIRFEFKHFPLVQIHPNATAAHRAAQAASNQGKFWEMHDRLFEQQQSWSQSNNPATVFQEYAQDLGLDMEQYNAEVGSSETLAVINADIALARDNDVSSTPTFFLDGEKIEDLTPISTPQGFAQFLQDAIDAKTDNSDQEPSSTEVDATEEPNTVDPAAKPEEEN